MKTTKFTVLGSGNGARAWCAQIAAKGLPVVMWEPLEATEDYLKLKEEKEIYLEGDMNIGGSLAGVTMDVQEAMDGAEFILVIVPSFAHEPIFRKMIPQLKDGQNIVVVPGNFAGFRLKKMMKEAGVERNITISEMTTMPYACRIRNYKTVTVYKKKFALGMGTSPKDRNGYVMDILNDVFAGYVKYLPADNLLQVDLDNGNCIVHPLPVLLNYGEIEKNGDTYRHYIDGITPLISEQIMKMDEERISIGKKLGLELTPNLTQLKMFYGQNDSETIYDYVHSPESPYFDLVGQSVNSRYLKEDVPGIVVPLMLLAKKAGMEAPICELVVKLASQLHGVDYVAEGTNLKTLGIEDLTIEEIVRMVS